MPVATLSIQHDDDDVEVRNDGSLFATGVTYVSVRADAAESSKGNIGGRFREGVPWSDAATINSAHLVFDITSTAIDDALCDIHLVDEANPAVWNGTSRRPYSGDLTLFGSVGWEGNSLGTGDENSSDITALVQRHQALGGGAGRAIAFVIAGRTNGSLLDLNCRNFANGGQVMRLVVDYTEPTDPPVLQTAAVSGDLLTLTYDEALDEASTPAASAFTVKVNTVAQASPSAVVVSGLQVELTLAAAVVEGDTVTVSYTPGGSPIQAADNGDDAAALVDQAVTNNTPAGGAAVPYQLLRQQRGRRQ